MQRHIVNQDLTYMCSGAFQATNLVEEKIVSEDKRKIGDDEKLAQVRGIMGLILPCNAVLHVAFPIIR